MRRLLTGGRRSCAAAHRRLHGRNVRDGIGAPARRASADEPGLVALLAQVARRAEAAAIAPRVTLGALAHVAGMGVLDDEVNQRIASEILGEGPGLRLV